jgi:hypothetical protein
MLDFKPHGGVEGFVNAMSTGSVFSVLKSGVCIKMATKHFLQRHTKLPLLSRSWAWRVI